MASRQFNLERSHAGIGIRQFLLDGQCSLARRPRSGLVARPRKHRADIVVAHRHVPLEVGDARARIRQLLLDHRASAKEPRLLGLTCLCKQRADVVVAHRQLPLELDDIRVSGRHRLRDASAWL